MEEARNKPADRCLKTVTEIRKADVVSEEEAVADFDQSAMSTNVVINPTELPKHLHAHLNGAKLECQFVEEPQTGNCMMVEQKCVEPEKTVEVYPKNTYQQSSLKHYMCRNPTGPAPTTVEPARRPNIEGIRTKISNKEAIIRDVLPDDLPIDVIEPFREPEPTDKSCAPEEENIPMSDLNHSEETHDLPVAKEEKLRQSSRKKESPARFGAPLPWDIIGG